MMLQLSNIHKHFGGVKAVEGCSFNIEKGKITAIIGPNGSGKSTVFNVVSQLLNEDAGTIHLEGKNITHLKDYEVAREGVARTFQEVRLFRNLTIQDHLEIALTQKNESLVRGVFTKRQKHFSQIKEILERVRLNKPLTTYATDLSYGQRKLLELTVALAKPHKILLLDEPVAGVNPQLRQEIKEILKELRKKGETIVLIEHDMNFVMDLADQIIVMDAGKVLVEGKPAEIQKNPKVLEAYLGE